MSLFLFLSFSLSFFFFFNDTATTEIYTLSLHDALPIHAMDVGAAGGVAPQWRDYLPVLEVDCFEPDAAECAARQRDSPANLHWFPVALAGTSGRRPFYVLNRSTGSSLYPPNDPVILEYSGHAYAGVRRVVDVECLSLRDFLVQYQRLVPALMKLHTQGPELETLSR